MQFVVEQHFDRPMTDVLKMFSDKGYIERKVPQTGATDLRIIRFNKTDEAVESQYGFRSKADSDLPDIAKKFVPGEMNVVQTSKVNLKTGKGSLKIELGSLPVQVGCDMMLEPTTKGCVNKLTWTIKVSVPLIGGKLEKILAEDMKTKMDKDYQISRSLLKEYFPA